MKKDKIEIINVLKKFQAGYTKRDTKEVENYVLDLFGPNTENVQIIGTDSRGPGTPEWCNGSKDIKDIIISDWEGWGDLDIDYEYATIHIDGNFAWLGVAGTLTSNYESMDVYLESLKNIDLILEEKELNPKLKLLKIEEDIGKKLFNAESGNQYVWPVKISAVLKKENSNWFFKQIHFSFPATIYPVKEDLKTCLHKKVKHIE